jgi:integrase
VVDALATVTPALVKSDSGRPDASTLRAARVRYAFHPPSHDGEVPADLADAVRWLESHSLPVKALADAENIRRALNEIAVRMDGQRAAATTIARKRAVFHSTLKYAVRELKVLDSNPLHDVDWSAPAIRKRVGPRVVPNPAQARQLLSATSYVGRLDGRGRRLMAMFACMYYAALRSGEAVGLREADCHLPEEGWGRIMLIKNRPQSSKRYTDSGESHDDKGTKRRGEDEVRPIPIPPVLVRILRDHVAAYGTAADGRLFATSTGKVVASSALGPGTNDRPVSLPGGLAPRSASARPSPCGDHDMAECRGARAGDRPEGGPTVKRCCGRCTPDAWTAMKSVSTG